MIESKEVFKSLLGLKPCELRVGYGGILRLGLGEKVAYQRSNNRTGFWGEWDIISNYCTWRVFIDNNILCAYDSEAEFSNKVLKTLEPGIVKDIIQITNYDIRIVFDSGLMLDYFYQATDEPILTILGHKKDIAFDLTKNGWVQSDPNEPCEGLTKIENFLSFHSEECHQRWKAIVPSKEGENECADCFYFRGITGHFYFWDYGICSNKDSSNDGKLVNVKSGCSCFKQLKDIINID